MQRYVALLRGINVGGKNKILMADLRAAFEEMGFEGVQTYIQSGNVVFETEMDDREGLVARLETELSQRFDYRALIVLRTQAEMRSVVRQAPEGFGSEPDLRRYDVAFLKEPLTAEEAMGHLSAWEGVDEMWAGDGVLYYSRLISRASQSRMGRVAGTPVYGQITVRNWRTTKRLEEMVEGGRRTADG